ncbi:MAG: LysE family transporter, partial [Desulfobacterales bacterium]
AFGGSAFLAYLAWESIRFKGVGVVQEAPRRPHGLRKGVIANFFNPSPYLFWFSIGAPMVLKAADTGYGSAALFIGGFYLFLVGSKLAVAVLVGQSRRFLQSFVYVMVVRLLGVVLVLFAGVFFKDGLFYWGILG